MDKLVILCIKDQAKSLVGILLDAIFHIGIGFVLGLFNLIVKF